MSRQNREGSLEAPTRHPIEWQTEAYWDEDDLIKELARVYDICHGCRRCVSLCNAFPTLFDLVDESDTMEVDGVDTDDYAKVVHDCYLCDLCYMTKCPYVPPHDWNVDFPHLMLRAKAIYFKKHGASFRDTQLTETDRNGKLMSIPFLDITANKATKMPGVRNLMEKTLDIHKDAVLPEFYARTLRKRVRDAVIEQRAEAINGTTGKVALFATCYGNYNAPHLGEDIFKVFQHNNIFIKMVEKESCCGMPKLEVGDLERVKELKEKNIPVLAKMVDEGFDLISPVPSCTLMFKQELPLMFPDDPDVIKVQAAFFDPFEYLFLRHKGGKFNNDFKQGLGDISYHVACHLRVQNIGLKARDILAMVPDTQVNPIERCSGHDGTYAVKKESHDKAVKIARPVVKKVNQQKADHLASDCPMAANHIHALSENEEKPSHPISLLRRAYQI